MNKDVIYIEPDDDITDIINRIKAAKQKVVALVPPKKLGVLRSAVNTKLIAKTAKSVDKAVVMVTTDQALLKLSVSASIPVAKNLQSRPIMPSEADEIIASAPVEEVIDESEPEQDESESVSSKTPEKEEAKEEKIPAKKSESEISSDDLEKEEEKQRKKESKKEKTKVEGKGFLGFIMNHRKLTVGVSIGIVGLVIFLVWALAIAPAAKVIVAVGSTSNNFSEEVSFTTKQAEQSVESGKFFLTEEKAEKKASAEFTATGSKNVGEKATGTLTLTATMKSPVEDITVPAGAIFTYGNFKYATNDAIKFTITDEEKCSIPTWKSTGCSVTANIAVTATEPGDAYNIEGHSTGWTSSVEGVSAYNSNPFTGGSSKTITLVTQEDVNKAVASLELDNTTDGKEDLKKRFSSNYIVIDSSYKQESAAPVVTPAVGEEVAEGAKAKVEITTTYALYGVEKTNVDAYIISYAGKTVASGQKVYSAGDPFFERYTDAGNGTATARLKSTVKVGPVISEDEIFDKIKGKSVNEVRSILVSSYTNVSTVNIEKSVPWVNKIPDNREKVDIDLTVDE